MYELVRVFSVLAIGNMYYKEIAGSSPECCRYSYKTCS